MTKKHFFPTKIYNYFQNKIPLTKKRSNFAEVKLDFFLSFAYELIMMEKIV